MKSKSLVQKEKEAIRFIRNAYELALKMSDRGFHLAFSGGKDSQVIYHLMEMSGCKFHAEMQVTSVDPPQLMKFVRKNYPKVNLNLPQINMKKLIIKKGLLPLQQIRYCCKELKEQAGAGECTVVGVRAAESANRAKRKTVEYYYARKPKIRKDFKIEGSNLFYIKEQFDLFEIKSEKTLTCVKGSDKIILSPILNWSDNDVWEFLRENNIPHCELYDLGFKRIGCMFCPMSSLKQKALDLKYFSRAAEKIYIPAIRELMKNGRYTDLGTPEEVFQWWISGKSTNESINDRKQTQIPFKENGCKDRTD